MMLFLLPLIADPYAVLGLAVLAILFMAAVSIVVFCHYLIALGVPLGVLCTIYIILIAFYINEFIETRYKDRIRSILLKCLILPIVFILIKILPHKPL